MKNWTKIYKVIYSVSRVESLDQFCILYGYSIYYILGMLVIGCLTT